MNVGKSVHVLKVRFKNYKTSLALDSKADILRCYVIQLQYDPRTYNKQSLL